MKLDLMVHLLVTSLLQANVFFKKKLYQCCLNLAFTIILQLFKDPAVIENENILY